MTSEGALSRYQRFEMRRVRRSQLAEAVYNPRIMGDEERRRLRENLAAVGLLEPVIWNEATGSLVGGHQRLAQLDALEKWRADDPASDYLLDVAVVQLDEISEAQQNVALNNPNLRGEWDMDRLHDVLWSDAMTSAALPHTGFDAGDAQKLFGDPELTARFEAASALPEGLATAPAPAAAPDVVHRDVKPENVARPAPAETAAAPAVERPKGLSRHVATPEQRAEESPSPRHAGNLVKPEESPARARQLVLVFRDRAAREGFMRRCGVPEQNRYIDQSRVRTLLGMTEADDEEV